MISFGSIGLYGAGDVFLGVHNTSGISVTPYGTWDFSHSNCDIILPDGVGGGSGGTAVAIFG